MRFAPRPHRGDTTFHKDGTVTVWDVYRQTWRRGSNPCDELLASLDETTRTKIIQHTGQDNDKAND